MRRFLLLFVLIAPLLFAQEDECPGAFPPDTCDTQVGGVTPIAPPPVVLLGCPDCWEHSDALAAAATCGCAPGCLTGACSLNPGGVSFLLLTCDPGGGPPPSVLAVASLNNPGIGDCSWDASGSGGSTVSGTYTSETRCLDEITYWETTLGITCS